LKRLIPGNYLKVQFFYFRGIKVDEESLYLTIEGIDKLFICHSHDGKLITAIGQKGSNECEFSDPMGLTVDNKNVYICEYGNKRIQILTKKDGRYVSQWNGFDHPFSIYYYMGNFYIGDKSNVHIRSMDGPLQTIGDKIRGKKVNQSLIWFMEFVLMIIYMFVIERIVEYKGLEPKAIGKKTL